MLVQYRFTEWWGFVNGTAVMSLVGVVHFTEWWGFVDGTTVI
jgi:hypothetical protein